MEKTPTAEEWLLNHKEISKYDIEDYDEVESDKMFQDDDYMEEIYDGLYELRDSLYEGYLEVKNEA